MIYLDNAATSFPKPAGVTEAMVRFAEDVGASPGRGTYAQAMKAGAHLTRCREALCRLTCAPSPAHVAFTLNATDALNQAIKGILRARAAAHAVSTDMDHNSILRPLNAMRDEGHDWTCVQSGPGGLVDPEDVRRAIRPDTALVALGHASNVTGAIQDVAAIGAICRDRGVLFVVDAAQTAGHLPIDMEAMNIDVLCVPGHKGLMGPLGTGAMIMRPGVEQRLLPLRHGGTGTVSELDTQPDTLPDRYESGSPNAIGIAGLLAGLDWLLDRGVDTIRAHETDLAALMRDRLAALDVRILAPDVDRVAVISIVHESIDAHTLAMLLEQDGMLARAGLHCAPRAHAALRTPASGALRFSAGPFTTSEDIALAAGAVESVIQVSETC